MALILGMLERQGWRAIMQVALTCPPIVIEGGMDSNSLEAVILTWGRQVMTLAYQVCWQQLEATVPPTCPRCQANDSVADGHRPYHLRTSFGPVVLTRQRRQCRQCRHHFQPGDAALPRHGRATAGLEQAAVLAAASWPFATAAWLLERLCGAQVSPEWVRQVAEAQGQAAATTSAADAEQLLAGATEVPPAPEPIPKQGLVVCDGGYVHTCDADTDNMEGKVAVLATGREPIGRARWRLTNRRYVATFASAETLASLTYQAAAELGLTEAKHLVVLGDGAPWISELAAWCFPHAERRLDLWHLLRRGHEAVVAEDLDEAATTARWATLRGQLRRGAVDDAQRLVRDELHGEVGQRFAGYLTHQRAWICDADALHAQGEGVGSGAIEKGVELVINRRFKGKRGMRWGRQAATAIVTLRTRILNDQAA
jgi:hypothetical protein